MYEVGEINLFKLVINPQSFAQSVENIFYLSFLIRDAQAAFQINEEGEPLVCALLRQRQDGLCSEFLSQYYAKNRRRKTSSWA
jgi:hypothetical protein